MVQPFKPRHVSSTWVYDCNLWAVRQGPTVATLVPPQSGTEGSGPTVELQQRCGSESGHRKTYPICYAPCLVEQFLNTLLRQLGGDLRRSCPEVATTRLYLANAYPSMQRCSMLQNLGADVALLQCPSLG